MAQNTTQVTARDIGTRVRVSSPNPRFNGATGTVRGGYGDYITVILDDGSGRVDAPAESLEHDPECTECKHACPWRRTSPWPMGPPFCSICDDHSEAAYALEQD